MNELLFFILGYIIGALSGIVLLSFLVISKQCSIEEEIIPVDKEDLICEQEK